MKYQTQHYFGGCPECGDQDGYTNVGRSHWVFCKAHRTMWCIGWNLFSSWQYETEAEQRLAYDAIGLEGFAEVAPMPWRPTMRERQADIRHRVSLLNVACQRWVTKAVTRVRYERKGS